ncbi:hypothetical protein [Roseibium sp.]|uniref:hypothetical protein n=1 Tax=Roseibium sp. TaxID=1936156 RepID=UPI003BABFF46
MKDISFQISWGGKGETRKLDAGEAAWPFNSDSPVIDGIVRPDRALSIMLVNLCGLEWEDIEPLLPAATRGAKDQGMLPVIIVDLTDMVPLQKAGLAYDCLPNVTAGSLQQPDLDWRAYFVRRKHLLIEKWRPEAIVHLGNDQDW